MDTSGKVVTATLWGEDADKFDGSRQPVLAIKGARVSDFGGRSLSVLSSSTIIANPDIPEAYKLRGWFDAEGQALDGVSISDLKSGGVGGPTPTGKPCTRSNPRTWAKATSRTTSVLWPQWCIFAKRTACTKPARLRTAIRK